MRAESDAELLASLFVDGVSTRSAPGDVSGRGVGLSAVKAAVEAFSGRVWLESEAGRGARLLIELPERVLG